MLKTLFIPAFLRLPSEQCNLALNIIQAKLPISKTLPITITASIVLFFTSTRSSADFYASIGDRKAGVVKGSLKGNEVHPANAYDGEQGNAYPKPTGAKDEYTYEISGTMYSVAITTPENAPKTLPKQALPIGPNQANQDNKTDNNDSRDDKIRQDNVDIQEQTGAIADDGEIKASQNDITANENIYYGDTCIDCVAEPNRHNYGGSFYPVGCFDSYCAGRAKGGDLQL